MVLAGSSPGIFERRRARVLLVTLTCCSKARLVIREQGTHARAPLRRLQLEWEQMSVVRGGSPDGLAGVVDDAVKALTGVDEVRAEALEGGEVS